MVKPVLVSHGLELYKLLPAHIMPFHENLSDENKREFEVVYGCDPLEALLSVMKDQMVFVVTRNDKVLAVTGIEDGQLWTMFSKDMKKNWVRFARASHDLMSFYHHFYDWIHCDVWAENEMIHQWLSHLGFEPSSIYQTETNQELVRFVRCKTSQDNVVSLLSRPVMH
jgi:hypothetical protein